MFTAGSPLDPVRPRGIGEDWNQVPIGPRERPPAARTLAFSPNGILAVGTQESGIFVRAPHAPFRNITRAQGLAWNYVSALAWAGDDLWVGTAGGGFAKVLDAASDTPRILNFPQGDRVHRYITRIIATGTCVWIATDCGLISTDHAGNVMSSWGREQLGNAYLTALWVRDPIIIVGHLHGGAVSMDAGNTWHALVKHPPFGPAVRRVRDVKLHHEWWLLATDGGLLASRNAGAEWIDFDTPVLKLPMRRIRGLGDDLLAAATPRGLVEFHFKEGVDNPKESVGKEVLYQPAGFPNDGDIHDLTVDPAGACLLAATTGGVFRRDKGEAAIKLAIGRPLKESMPRERFPFLSFPRPIGSNEQPHQDQTYLFGTTCRGEFPVHQGIDINVPKGTPILSCGDGTVVRVTGPEMGHRIFIDHDTQHDGWVMTTVYVHASTLFVKEGDHVTAGQRLAAASDVGRATNSHLHFEVRWRRAGEPLDASRLGNPELWLQPVKDTDGAVALINAPDDAEIVGFLKEFPPETAYHLSEAPSATLTNDSPGSGWLVVSDLPPGTHEITLRSARGMQRLSVPVVAGRLSLYDLKDFFA